MKNIYLFSALIICSCSVDQQINIQYEINDNVSSEKTTINCSYLQSGEKYFTIQDCGDYGRSNRSSSHKIDVKDFKYSPTLVYQIIDKLPLKSKSCMRISDCPNGTYVSETSIQEISWVYDPKSTKKEYKKQLSEVGKEFNIRLYPPLNDRFKKGEGFILGTLDNIYDFYISSYSKHSRPEAMAKICLDPLYDRYNTYLAQKVAETINISYSVSPQSANDLISLRFYKGTWQRPFKNLCMDPDDRPYFEETIAPRFYFYSEILVPDQSADLGDIKVTIDINENYNNLDNLFETLAKDRDKESSGYCVYKQSDQDVYHRIHTDYIASCRTTCFEHVYNHTGRSLIKKPIPAKLQYSVSDNEIYRGEFDKNDLHEDESGVKLTGIGFVNSFYCP